MQNKTQHQTSSYSDQSNAYALRDMSTVRKTIAGRTAAKCAAFFLPHLRSSMRLLDCGCGPGSITLDLAEVVAQRNMCGYSIN